VLIEQILKTFKRT